MKQKAADVQQVDTDAAAINADGVDFPSIAEQIQNQLAVEGQTTRLRTRTRCNSSSSCRQPTLRYLGACSRRRQAQHRRSRLHVSGRA